MIKIKEKGKELLRTLLNKGAPRDLQAKLRLWMLLPRLKEGLSVS